MKKYQIQNSIGSGNFSNVFKGVMLPDGRPCAIKVVKNFDTIAERQAQLLKKFKHPNIISIMGFEQDNNQSRLILQYMGINALELYQTPQVHGLQQHQIKSILFQAALGLSYVHSQNIIHRDIKPENILIDKNTLLVKLIDFGLAIEDKLSTTDYIATRWYRAPENLLETKEYTCAIDIFSLACVIFQLFNGRPLFPGADNPEQISKIFEVLGPPNPMNWPRGYEQLKKLGIIVYDEFGTGLKKLMNNCDPRLVYLLQRMLELNPKLRITSTQLLKSQYFNDIKSLIPLSVYTRFQQDILTKKSERKPLSFKGFQAVKGTRTGSIEPVSRSSKINFNNVSGKTKFNDALSAQIGLTRIIQQPRLLRQQKSTSVDSLPTNFQSIKLQKQSSQNKSQQNPGITLQNCSSLRKLSSPTQNSNLNLNFQLNLNLNFQLQPGQHLQKINSPALFFNFKEQQQSPKNAQYGNSRNYNTGPQKIDKPNPQEQTKQYTPSNCGYTQQNNQKSFSQFPRIQIPNIIKSKNQNQVKKQNYMSPSPTLNKNTHSNSNGSINGSTNQVYRNNNNYPVIPNVQFVPEQSVSNNSSFSNVPMRAPPLKDTKSSVEDKSNKSSFHHPQQSKSSSNLILSCNPKPSKDKSFDFNANYSQTYRGYQNYQGFLQNSFKEDNKIGKIHESAQVKPNAPRNSFVPYQNTPKIQQVARKPDIFSYSNNEVGHNKSYFLSPNPRFYGNSNPDNNQNPMRSNRLNTTNLPNYPFFSPPQRKF